MIEMVCQLAKDISNIQYIDRAATVTGLLLQLGKKIGNPSQCGLSDRMTLSLDFTLLKTERDCLRKKSVF